MRKLLLLTAILLSGSSAKAQSVYTVTMNTAPLAGHGSFTLDLQLLDGSGLSPDLNNNTVTLTNFNFGTGGAPLGNGVPTNGATGNLATSVTLQDSAFFNEYVESFAAGSSLSFTVTITNVADPGGTPDLFTFAILDSNGNEITTTGFANEFLSMSLEGGAAPKVSANTSAPNAAFALDAPSALLQNSGGAPAAATIHVNGYTGVYDGNPHGATGSATGVNGEDLSSLLNLGASFTNVPGGTAHWTFAGNANNAPASGDVSIIIAKATPTITWNNPADIVYGTALSATQLNATASVPGSLIYSPSSGTLLSAGMNQPLLASFTPTDTTNYNSASKTVQINVLKATASFTNLSSPTILYGTATVNVTGKISFGSFIPTGSVAITLNGVTQNTAIQADGTFSSNFATISLAPATPPYSIGYSYGGDSNFNPSTGSGSLTVVYNIVPLYDQTQAHQSGSTIPIKLEVVNATGSNLSSSNLIVTAVGVSLISTNAYGPVADSGNANPDSNFRLDSNTYIFNLQTTGLGTGVYNLYFRVGADPTLHTVRFQIR